MGVRWSVLVLFSWVFLVFVIGGGTAGAAAVAGTPLCEIPGCKCLDRAPAWKAVNCTLHHAQELKMDLVIIAREMGEICITGGRSISLGQKTFSEMSRLSLLRIDGTHTIVLEPQAFHDLTHPSLFIDIQNCDRLNIKTGAFENVQSSIEINVINCTSVSVEKLAFNKLFRAFFKDIRALTLQSNTFEFKKKDVGKHGPVTNITFESVSITKIPHHAFISSMAEIAIKNSTIETIETEAFTPLELNSIYIADTVIDRIEQGAIGDRTLVYNLKISKCTIAEIAPNALKAGVTNLTVQHSRITDFRSGAINTTVNKVEIVGNEIARLHSQSFVLHNVDRIYVEQNIIKSLYSHFLVTLRDPEFAKASVVFTENEIYNLEPSALSFVPDVDKFVYKDNFFNQTCHCTFNEWISKLINDNSSARIRKIVSNTFCPTNSLLAKCFKIEVGNINMQNFTELACHQHIICMPYEGETKIVNTTSKMLFENNVPKESNYWALIIGASSLCIFLVFVITAVAMIVRGSRWLKRKGYFRKIHYNQNNNEPSNDEENTIETVDESDPINDVSEDLTLDLLQDLSKKLDDPNTHHQASEMIEQLYQKYIRNGGTMENNMQSQNEDDTHLYEELGNLQQASVPRIMEQDLENGPRSILKMMEERFNTQFEDIDADDDDPRPALAGDYSEPSDAAVHLYSELRQSKESEQDNKDSLKSRGSSNMAFRPLPDKPGPSKT